MGHSLIYLQIASLAAHKKPNLSILQIGRSDSLTRSLISAFSAHDPSNLSLASYIIMDKETEAITQTESTFQNSTSLITFYAGDIESGRRAQTLKDDTFDVVIAIDDLNSADEIDHLVKCLHKRGNLIVKGSKQQQSLGFNSIDHIRTLSDISILSCFSDENWYAARKVGQIPIVEGDTIFIIEPRESSTEIVEVSHQLSTKLTS